MENNIFILVCSCMIPAIMVVLGFIMWRHHPKQINYFFGYRTAKSMLSLDTWNFANEYEGKLWFICGLTLLIPTILLYVVMQDQIMMHSIVIITVQAVVFVLTFIPVEMKLRKNFDDEGKKK